MRYITINIPAKKIYFQGSSTNKDKIEALSKQVQETLIQALSQATELASSENTALPPERKAVFLESANRLEQYLKENVDLPDFETLWSSLSVMKAVFLRSFHDIQGRGSLKPQHRTSRTDSGNDSPPDLHTML